MNYRLAYAVGFHPWESAIETPAFVASIERLFDEAEVGRDPPYGSALDLGTGSGIWGVELAKRGWQVTGVDIVEKALGRARDRVDEAGVEMELVRGDVTDLRGAGVDGEYRLVLDTGTYHGLTSEQRAAMAREVDAVAGDEATVLLLAWEPKRRGPLPRGATREELEANFPGWEVTDLGRTNFTAPKPVEILMKPNEHWYRLRRE
ncbi:class I SAM-dependent methyltransferase [Natrononativus amylolyticus]|uniref:class I SAM-dependent methyltransferase n=1 Tax=Natrononativus amylolyticus TaxID=2963434 RepID=UPI0020CF3F37|nr:class I SAM-dependent methyltransferase [Natrononativus amylolyticus]